MQRSDVWKQHLLIEDFWLRGYYSSLINCRVVGVKVNSQVDDYGQELWPVIVFEDASGEQFECEISRDPEGNGAGFLFGLPQYVLPDTVKEAFQNMSDDQVNAIAKGKWGI